MSFEFKFPDVGEGITEGTIVKWNVKNGDKVKSDQPIVEIETDKAVVEIPCPKAGMISKIKHTKGETINVGEVLCVIDENGKKQEKKEKKSKKKPTKKKSKEKYTGSVVGFVEEGEQEIKRTIKSKKSKKAGERVHATFRVRQLAKKMNVDINSVKGSGRGGRITEDDVRQVAGKGKTKVTEAKLDYPGKVEKIALKGVRKTISEHLHEANQESVMVTNFHDANVDTLWDLRKKEKRKADKKKIKLTFLPYIIKATVEALKKNPVINASLDGEEIIIKKFYNIGVAVDTDDGLIVPVLKGADKKDLFGIAKEIGEIAKRARNRKLQIEELRGGSFSITNLGSIGVKYFTPVVNYPESAILGLGRIEDKAVVVKGKVQVSKIIPLSLTYDHRIIDGAAASRFMLDLIELLENPSKIK